MNSLFYIGLFGALGAISRYLCQLWIPSQSFPWSTLVVNVGGSALLGFLFAYFKTSGTYVPAALQLGLIVGFCGGWTTFSSFSLQALQLLEEGQWVLAGQYILATNILCVLAVFLGMRSYDWIFS